MEWSEAHWKMVGQRIRRIREEQRLTQPDLAARSGVPATRISEIELGKRPGTTFETMADLADGLGVSVGLFVKDDIEVARCVRVRYLGLVPSTPLELQPAIGGELFESIPASVIGSLNPADAMSVRLRDDLLASEHLHAGDLVLVNTKAAQVQQGAMCLVRTATEITFKRVYREPGKVRLVSPSGLMAEMQPDEAEVLGVVIGGGRWFQLEST